MLAGTIVAAAQGGTLVKRPSAGPLRCRYPAVDPNRRLAPRFRVALHVEGGADRRLHRCHLRDHQLVLQLDGSSRIWWGEADCLLTLPAGSIAFLPPLRPFAASVGGALMHVHFDLDARPELDPVPVFTRDPQPMAEPDCRDDLLPWFPLANDLRVLLITALDKHKAWRQRCERLLLLYRNGAHRSLRGRLESGGIIAALLEELGELAERQLARAQSAPERIRRMLRDSDLLRERPSIAALAAELDLSENGFREAFRRVTGATPQRWFEARRMNWAADLLRHGGASAAAIASELGYPDSSHFNRAFKRVHGCSPSAYRDGD